jgi:hypothetical protein
MSYWFRAKTNALRPNRAFITHLDILRPIASYLIAKKCRAASLFCRSTMSSSTTRECYHLQTSDPVVHPERGQPALLGVRVTRRAFDRALLSSVIMASSIATPPRRIRDREHIRYAAGARDRTRRRPSLPVITGGAIGLAVRVDHSTSCRWQQCRSDRLI